MRTKIKGFTVIELLVVVAIIGLLSSLALVGMRGSTHKSRIAKSLEFSHTTMNIIGVDAKGIWSFDEGAGDTAFDKSGYGNHGDRHGATWVNGDEDTPHWHVNESEGRFALKFDGNDWVDCGNASSLDITDAITIEAWAKPDTIVGVHGITGRHTSGNNAGGTIRISSANVEVIINIGGNYTSFITADDPIIANRWHHVVYTYSGAMEKIYVNGIEKVVRNNSGVIFTPVPRNYIGATTGPTQQNFNGLIDEVRIYARALSSAEIQQHYAESAFRHNLAIR